MRNSKILKRALGQDVGCLSIESLGGLLEPGLANVEKATAQTHLDECPHCRCELEMLRQFESGEVAPAEQADVLWIASRIEAPCASPPVTVGSRWRGWINPRAVAGLGAVAAVLVLAVGLSEQWRSGTHTSEALPEFKEEIQRARSVEILPTPGMFAWQPVPGAVDYALKARNVDGSALFSVTLTETRLAFPPEVARIVGTGKLILWEIVARDRMGNTLAQSGIQRIHK